MRAVQLTAYGNPVEGLKYVDIPEPEAPGPNQVLIGVEFSPINPSDLLLARGIYGIRPALPTVIGGEGVGRVLAVGAGVENVKVGDRVLAPLSSFTWRERMVVPASGLFALPPGADPQQLSMLDDQSSDRGTAAQRVRQPEAGRVGGAELREFVGRAVGDRVRENARLKDRQHRPAARARARASGDWRRRCRRRFSRCIERDQSGVGQAELRLALDGVSGPATGVLASTLSPHGTLVSFAAMSQAPMSISPLDVIFKPITMRGFWLGHPESAAKSAPAIAQAAEMIASGRVHIPVAATYALSSIKEAVAHAQRGGKILLEVGGSSN